MIFVFLRAVYITLVASRSRAQSTTTVRRFPRRKRRVFTVVGVRRPRFFLFKPHVNNHRFDTRFRRPFFRRAPVHCPSRVTFSFRRHGIVSSVAFDSRQRRRRRSRSLFFFSCISLRKHGRLVYLRVLYTARDCTRRNSKSDVRQSKQQQEFPSEMLIICRTRVVLVRFRPTRSRKRCHRVRLPNTLSGRLACVGRLHERRARTRFASQRTSFVGKVKAIRHYTRISDIKSYDYNNVM